MAHVSTPGFSVLLASSSSCCSSGFKNYDWSHLSGLLSKESSEEDFTGKTGQAIVLRLRGLGSKRIGLIGLGSTTSAIASYRNLGETLDDTKLKIAEVVRSGIIFGKELVNAPTNVLIPGILAGEAMRIASEYIDVFTATILDVEQCKQLKMGSYLGVAAASANPPHFIHLCY
ncbi:unnamed protein product [Fraxinus pennsylvanica]|uniref:Uncharacterized protein n=1 Tax=Fraxinus pennsylvanica TaxID=56036 RepID=A0AAD2ECT7_9LAMI|nr:unnamed protein product [Fraxinus pennsylvanica]